MKGSACPRELQGLPVARVDVGELFAGGAGRPCTYWTTAEPAPTADATKALVKAADASSSANAAAGAARLEASLPALLAVPPVDHFRTRCLTFAKGVLQQSGHDKAAAYGILDHHCGERASGLQVPKLSAAEKDRCRRFAEDWLEQEAWEGEPALEASGAPSHNQPAS